MQTANLTETYLKCYILFFVELFYVVGGYKLVIRGFAEQTYKEQIELN